MMDFLQKLRDMIPSRRITIDNTTNPEWVGYEDYHRRQKEAQTPRPELKDLGEFSVSAYNPRRNQTDADPWIAPRNFNLKEGTERGGKYVAVARKGLNDPTPMIPYGTKVRVNNDEYEVRDLMGLYAGPEKTPQYGTNRMDIFIPDESDDGYRKAINHGRKNLRVYQ